MKYADLSEQEIRELIAAKSSYVAEWVLKGLEKQNLSPLVKEIEELLDVLGAKHAA